MINRISPWNNKSVAPMQAAAPIIPVIYADNGCPMANNEGHGTIFFISNNGLFLTAAHVVSDYCSFAPPFFTLITSALGITMLKVAWTKCHPIYDVAIGQVMIEESNLSKVNPLILSSKKLVLGTEVAVLGYPRTKTEYQSDDHGNPSFKFTMTPDYYEGKIEDYISDGTPLIKGPLYQTDITITCNFNIKDLSGVSGGPLVSSNSLHVHGIFSSSTDDYALFTDIETVLNWDIFELHTHNIVSII